MEADKEHSRVLADVDSAGVREGLEEADSEFSRDSSLWVTGLSLDSMLELEQTVEP